ncbi:MAG: sulfatase [Candidatus Brocadiia bacterium]
MSEQPNVLILHTDQQRYPSLGCTGNPTARTPNLDALADKGCLFSRHIVSNTISEPSRASLMTGLYPPGHNVWTNGVPLAREDDYGPEAQRKWPIPATGNYTTMADLFADAGYDTAAFGKLHLTPNLADPRYGFGESFELADSGALSDWHGPYYGFQHVEQTRGHGEGPSRGGHYGEWLQSKHPEVLERMQNAKTQHPIEGKNDLYASEITSDVHHSEWLANRFAQWLKNRKNPEEPFFSFIGFPDPHHSLTPPRDLVEELKDKSVLEPVDPEGAWWQGSPLQDTVINEDRSVLDLTTTQRREIIRYYDIMVHNIDRAVGEIMASLEHEKLENRTIVIFTSDHGDFMGDHGLIYKALAAADSLLHVPFVLHVPGKNLPRRIEAAMSNCDVLPTLLNLCGLKPPCDIHGEDILEIHRSGRQHRALAYCFTPDGRGGNFTVYDDNYRLTHYPVLSHTELYDHRKDPGETQNLATDPAHRDVRDELLDHLRGIAPSHTTPRLCRLSSW